MEVAPAQGQGKSCGNIWKFVTLVGVGGITQGYIEVHGSFHGNYLWKLPLMEAMEASTSTDSGNFHVFPWRLLRTFHGSKYASTNLHGNFHGGKYSHFHRQWKLPCASMEAFTNFHVNFHGSKFTFVETSMEVDETSEIMWRAHFPSRCPPLVTQIRGRILSFSPPFPLFSPLYFRQLASNCVYPRQTLSAVDLFYFYFFQTY